LQPVPICPHLAALSIHPNFVRILSTLILYVRLLLADGYAECGRLLANGRPARVGEDTCHKQDKESCGALRVSAGGSGRRQEMPRHSAVGNLRFEATLSWKNAIHDHVNHPVLFAQPNRCRSCNHRCFVNELSTT